MIGKTHHERMFYALLFSRKNIFVSKSGFSIAFSKEGELPVVKTMIRLNDNKPGSSRFL